jgi:hypothetical protein
MKARSTTNPRSSAELISTPHYFSVLKGLARAPRLVALDDLDRPPAGCLTVNSVGAIVAPATALGGLPALAAELHGIPLIAVRENATILSMTAERLGMRDVIEVESYFEAAGVVLALKSGLSLESLRRPIVRAEFMDAIPLKKTASILAASLAHQPTSYQAPQQASEHRARARSLHPSPKWDE